MAEVAGGWAAPVISDDYSRRLAQWSPDGMQLAYERRKLRTNEQQRMVWFSQSHGKWLVACQTTPQATEIWLVPLASAPHAERKAQKIVSDSTHLLFQSHASRNGRWIVFEAIANSPNPESTLYTVPMSGGR